jgi:hypothetical protein
MTEMPQPNDAEKLSSQSEYSFEMPAKEQEHIDYWASRYDSRAQQEHAGQPEQLAGFLALPDVKKALLQMTHDLDVIEKERPEIYKERGERMKKDIRLLTSILDFEQSGTLSEKKDAWKKVVIEGSDDLVNAMGLTLVTAYEEYIAAEEAAIAAEEVTAATSADTVTPEIKPVDEKEIPMEALFEFRPELLWTPPGPPDFYVGNPDGNGVFRDEWSKPGFTPGQSMFAVWKKSEQEAVFAPVQDDAANRRMVRAWDASVFSVTSTFGGPGAGQSHALVYRPGVLRLLDGNWTPSPNSPTESLMGLMVDDATFEEHKEKNQWSE